MWKRLTNHIRKHGFPATCGTVLHLCTWRVGRVVGEWVGDAIFFPLLGGERTLHLKQALFRQRARVLAWCRLDTHLWLGRKLERKMFQRIEWVPPDTIQFAYFRRHIRYPFDTLKHLPLHKRDGDVPYVQSGDWDLQRRPFELHPTMVELYVEHRDYRETGQYGWMKEHVERGKPAYWCTTLADIDTYFEVLQRTAREIAAGRYLVQSQMQAEDSDANGRYPDEIVVSRGRDGALMHERGGTHRLSAAKIFHIEKVPVVVVRHHALAYDGASHLREGHVT